MIDIVLLVLASVKIIMDHFDGVADTGMTTEFKLEAIAIIVMMTVVIGK